MLLDQIICKISQIQNAGNEDQLRFQDVLKLAVLEKNQNVFVTDGNTCIQVVMSVMKKIVIRDDFPTPFNRLRSPYYNFQVKQAKYFNFNFKIHDEEIFQEIKYPHPYSPLYYFANKIQLFVQEKSNITYKILESIEVKQWGLRIVNIANTGYYGVVLQIFQYEKQRDHFPPVKVTNLILYNKEIQSKLEKLRVRDIKGFIGLPQNKNKGSLCYYMKNIKANPAQVTKSPFVLSDKQGKIIKNNKNSSSLFYIPIGNLEGVYRFIRPLSIPNNITNMEKARINFNKLSDLVQKRGNGKIQIEVIESSDEESYNDMRNDEIDEQIGDKEEKSLDEDEDESSQQQPLRLLYKKQMQNMKII